jgi:multiple sugar transport system ATP-binding protein
MAKVTLKKVVKIYPGQNGRDITAVRDLDLELQNHEFVVLLGPPGSGLSSIVRMISGLDQISKGDIFINDRRVNDLPPAARDVAFVSGDHAFYPRMSVFENLAFGLKMRKFPAAEIKRRVLAAADVLGVQELLERKPQTLSPEQRQRVAIARAVALQPKVFLFDDPLVTVEAGARGAMRHEIAKLHQRLDATMIYATHDPGEAMALGGRIVVMSEGALQQDGTARALYEGPANVFVAGFIGTPPINFIRGSLKQERDWLLFSEVGDGTIEVRLPASGFQPAGEFAGKPVLLGIRPEAIGIADPASTEKHGGNFPALVDFVEVMGAGTNLHLQTGAHTIVCRVSTGLTAPEAGHRWRFALNLNELCLFDPGSTRRITPLS